MLVPVEPRVSPCFSCRSPPSSKAGAKRWEVSIQVPVQLSHRGLPDPTATPWPSVPRDCGSPRLLAPASDPEGSASPRQSIWPHNHVRTNASSKFFIFHTCISGLDPHGQKPMPAASSLEQGRLRFLRSGTPLPWQLCSGDHRLGHQLLPERAAFSGL